MRNRKQINGGSCKRLLKLGLALCFGGMFVPAASAVFEHGYTFETPSIGTNVQDVLGGTHTAEVVAFTGNIGDGPTLTAAAARNGGVGLDFTSFAGNTNLYSPPYIPANYSGLRTQSSTITFQHGMTLAFWFNPSYWPTGTLGVAEIALYWAGHNRGAGETKLALRPDGTVRFRAESAAEVISTSTFASNEWAHLAITWDDVSDTVKLYKNGVLDVSYAGPTTLLGANSPTPSRLIWGQYYSVSGAGASTQFHGYMDDLYVADFAKTQSQIQTLMNVIPEPSSTALALGALAFVIRLFRRR